MVDLGPRVGARASRRRGGEISPLAAPASSRVAWTTRDTTSPSTRWATTSSSSSRSTRWTARLPRRRSGQRLHRGAGPHLPGAGPRAARPGQAERARRAAPRPERLLGHLGDLRRRAPGHRRLALDVRPPRGHARRSCGRRRSPSPATCGTRHYAPVLVEKDSALLGIYSHIIAPSFLYLPAYPLGHLIAFQLEEKLQGPRSGAEFERVASFAPGDARTSGWSTRPAHRCPPRRCSARPRRR